MHSAWFRGTFLRALKFLQIKDGDLISEGCGGTNFAESLNYLVPLLYLYFKSFMHPNSSSLIRFQCILHNSGVLFSESQNLYKLKTGGPNLWGEPILESVWIIWFPLLYFNFESFMESNSLSFISFQCILHDAGVLFPECWNFYKLQRADLISGRNQFAQSLNYLVTPSVFEF